MKSRRFIQCDVFSPTPMKGNGLAVVIDAQGLSDIQMQEFAAWTNLAETTFLFPPTDPAADYTVRIFTPAYEMLFAGHPTLGSCASWLHSGGIPKQNGIVRQECGIGIVEIDISDDIPAFVAPPTIVEPLSQDDFQTITEALKIDPNRIVRTAKLDNGPIWHVLELATADDVLAIDSAMARSLQYDGIGLIGPHPEGSSCHFEVRMFGPTDPADEDPITGSLNSAIAKWMQQEGRLNSDLVVAQGTAINRHGRIHIRLDPTDSGRVLIGGETNILIEGTLLL